MDNGHNEKNKLEVPKELLDDMKIRHGPFSRIEVAIIILCTLASASLLLLIGAILFS